MTDEQTTIVQGWLNEHWLGRATCPAGHSQWSVADRLSFMPGFVTGPTGAKIAHEAGFTFVVLTCAECAYVAFLDAKAVGL